MQIEEKNYIVGEHREKRNKIRDGVRNARKTIPRGSGRDLGNLSKFLTNMVKEEIEKNVLQNGLSAQRDQEVEWNTADFDFNKIKNSRRKQDKF